MFILCNDPVLSIGLETLLTNVGTGHDDADRSGGVVGREVLKS